MKDKLGSLNLIYEFKQIIENKKITNYKKSYNSHNHGHNLKDIIYLS